MTASSPHQRAPEQSEIYFNAGGWRVRIAQAGINLAGALIIWLAFFSEGHVGSFGEQVFVWLMGALAPLAMAAMTLYVRAYVVRMRLEGGLEVTTLDVLGRRSFKLDPAMADFGAVERDRRGVDNSWMLMRAPGELLPFIVDVSAARIEPGALQRAVARGRK